MGNISSQPTGMRGFTIIWLRQFTSILGSTMTNFALTIWAWEKTGTATALALTSLAFVLPNILVYPIAGALVDRWNRKLVMMLSDLAAGVGTIAIFFLYLAKSLRARGDLAEQSTLGDAGRVFSARAFIALISQPLAMVIAGPLADGFLLPGMMDGSSLVPFFGWLIGIGPGKGISLLFLVTGLVSTIVGIGGYLLGDVRDVESILPDYDATGISSETTVGV
jgi:DHA3 family macrolide efflux protein-like MFS transporter